MVTALALAIAVGQHPASRHTTNQQAPGLLNVLGRPKPAAGRADPSYLAAGSDPGALPGPILIADKGNNRLLIIDPLGRIRWEWPRGHDLRRGESFLVPDDAFVTPDGRNIIATQEDNFVISVISTKSRRIVWRYGEPGSAGSGPNQLWNPDDAMVLRTGVVVAADIKNCRLLWIGFSAGVIRSQQGQPGACWHDPPYSYSSPNGVFPLANGNFLVTEINGDWVDEVAPDGTLVWTGHPPGVAYPSDSNQIGPDRYLTVDYSSPGQVVEFDRAGNTLWRYAPTGSRALNHPSLAEALPNGDILMTDDGNDRVIVIDPRTNRIVWQYGHTGAPGSAAGFLRRPDGLDPLPPYSYADHS